MSYETAQEERERHDQEIADDNKQRQERLAKFEGEEGGSPVVSTSRVLGPFTFDHSTPNLNEGIEFYTPNPGDILVDAMIFTPEGWNGTTPRFDFGPSASYPPPAPQGVGMFRYFQEDVWIGVDITEPDNTPPNGIVTVSWNDGSSLSNQKLNAYAPSEKADGGWLLVHEGPPWKLWVSQDGLMGGAAAGSTQGTGKFYIAVATPVPFS